MFILGLLHQYAILDLQACPEDQYKPINSLSGFDGPI